jgi:glyoxylase-like metal-dependent hydrolase (beta-lactamase superfamily II)
MSLSFPVSATVRAPGRFVDGAAPPGKVTFPVRYGLLLHPRHGAVLVDTGYSRELWALSGFQAAAYRRLLSPTLRAEGDVDAVLGRAGVGREDVRHMIVTHLHPDHVSALARFSRSRIHLGRAALAQWSAPPSILDASHGLLRGLLPGPGSIDAVAFENSPRVPLPWGGHGHDLFGDGSVVSVALPGHMSGHAGILFDREGDPLLYAVDVSWTRAGYRAGGHPPYPARLAVADLASARESADAVRRAEEAGIRVALCHDPEPLPEDA